MRTLIVNVARSQPLPFGFPDLGESGLVRLGSSCVAIILVGTTACTLGRVTNRNHFPIELVNMFTFWSELD